MAANVVAIIAARTHRVGLVFLIRKLYRSANAIQIRWNGIASHRSKMTIPARPRIQSTIQAMSSHPAQLSRPPASAAGAGNTAAAALSSPPSVARRSGPAVPLARWPTLARSGSEPITRTAHRFDQVEPELGPQPPDADVHHIRSGVEIDAPYRRQQLVLGDRLARMLHELPEHHDLQPRQRHRARPGVGLE